MKKVSVFLVCVLAVVLGTSCGDDKVELTGIAVAQESISLPYGGEIQLSVRTIPENADSQTFTYSSSDESVATVSPAGLVKITGVGTATITVTNGAFSKTITVTATLTDIVVTPAIVPNFTQVGQTLQLSAVGNPDLGTKFTFISANPAVISVTADGLLEAVSEGTTTITISGGGLSKEVAVALGMSQVERDKKGWWTFDDPTNVFKATIGQDLIPDGWDDKTKSITAADGPTANNGAINVPRYNFLTCVHGIAANGPSGAANVNEYAIMLDVMELDASQYHTLLQFEVDASLKQRNEAAFYLKSRGRIGVGPVGDSPDGTTESGKWYRLIINAKVAPESGYIDYYLNGELLKKNPYSAVDHNRFTIRPWGCMFFADTRTEAPWNETGDGYNFDDDGLYVAEIAIWGRALTADEIAQLGMFEVE